jgi:hypothetical protein
MSFLCFPTPGTEELHKDLPLLFTVTAGRSKVVFAEVERRFGKVS